MEIFIVLISIIVIINKIQLYKLDKTITKLNQKIADNKELIKDLYRIDDERLLTAKQTESKSRPDGKTYSCASCGLYKNALSPKMRAYGEFKKEILNIGEAPGEVEDKRGMPWQGKSGRLLKKVYRRLGGSV